MSSYRMHSIVVPKSNPFENDALNRTDSVNFLADIVTETRGNPLVLAIDSPYGTGKSTFIEMLSAVLNQKNFQTVSFNAWEADHVSDPLIAMVAALDSALPDSLKGGATTGKMEQVKKVASILIKRGAIVGVKMLTAGVVDASDEITEALSESAGEATTDIIDAFKKEKEAAKCFREELEKVIVALPSINKKPTLVFFIDELDRCRPDFAMSLLERVKHMFDVPNMAFVLSVDKKQLEAVTASVYGERIDAPEYLRKFIDLEFGLPRPANNQFIRSAMRRVGLDKELSSRGSKMDTIVRTLDVLSDVYGMSLRAIERCITRLKLVVNVTPQHQRLDMIHIALLIVLRSVDRDMFEKVVFRRVAPPDVMQHLRLRPNATGKLDGPEGLALEAVLIVELLDQMALDEYRATRSSALERNDMHPDDRARMYKLLSLVQTFADDSPVNGRTMAEVAARIDIAANIN